MPWLRKLFDPAVPRGRRLLRALLLVLLVAACAFRVWLVFRYKPTDHLWSDPWRHWYLGTHPLDTSALAAIDQIGYQIFLGVLGKLTVGSPILVAYWTALLSAIGPWLWYRFFRELLPSREWALAGWVLLAALPSWSAIYSYFMQETVALPLLGAALWTTWRCRRKADLASFVVATSVWILAGLTRGICIPLAIVAMSLLWIVQPRKLAKGAAAMALALAVLVPLGGRSWSIARLFAPIGIAPIAQLYYRAGTTSIEFEFTRQKGKERWTYTFTSPAVNHAPLAPLSNWRGSREWKSQFSIDLDEGRRDWDEAMDRLPPWTLQRYVRLTAENVVQLLFAPSWPDSNLEQDRERTIGRLNYWLRWIWAPAALLCLIFTLVRWRQEKERLLPALLATWLIVQGLLPLMVNEGRYRKPFEGMLIAQCLLLGSGVRRRYPGGDSETRRYRQARRG